MRAGHWRSSGWSRDKAVRGGASSSPGRGGVGEGALLLALCAVLYWLTTRFDSVPAALSQNVPPEFFPRLLLAVIALLAVVLMLRGGGGKDGAGSPGHSDAPAENRKGLVAAATVWLACALFTYVGAAPAMFFSCLALPLIWGERRRGMLALYALGFPAAVYAVFALLLEVRFPDGGWN